MNNISIYLPRERIRAVTGEADYVHLTPYNYAGNKPITHYDIDGMQSSDDSDNSDKVYHAVGPEIEFKADGLGNAEQGFKDWFNNLGGFASLDSFRETLYQSKLSSFQSQIGKGGIGALMYGTDRYGITQIPNSIKQKFRQEAIEEAFPTLKEIWATQVSGYSSSTLNPLGRINYKAVRAGAVTSYSEGKSIVTSVAMETGLEWIMHAPSLSTSKNLVNLVRKTETRTVGVVEGQAVALADAELLPTVLRIEGAATKGVGRIQGESIRDIGKLANKLSQYESRLGLDELKALEKLVQKHGGSLRYDLNPVKGKFLHPHVQIENLTPSIKSRHIWLGEDAIKYLQK